MPVQRGKDADGPFFRWGRTGRKYRYRTGDERGRDRARARAVLQGRAAQAKAPKSDTPAKRSERRRGSARNKPGTASGSRGGIRISEATEKTLRDNQDKVPDDARQAAESVLAEARKELDSEDTARLDAARQRVEQEMHKIAEILYKSQPDTEGAAGAQTASSEQAASGGDDVIDAEYTEDKGNS